MELFIPSAEALGSVCGVFVIMAMTMAVMVRGNRHILELVCQKGADCRIRIVFLRDEREDAALRQALMQAGTHAGSDQHIDSGERRGQLVMAGMEALLFG